MTPKTTATLIAIAGPVIVAASQDFDAFSKARAADHTVTFDWALFAARMGKAAGMAFIQALGIAVSVPGN